MKCIYVSVGCKHAFIRGHTVDGAKSARKSFEQLEFMTEDDRRQKIMTNPCDSHKINTSFTQDYGTSVYVYNLNPDCGNS